MSYNKDICTKQFIVDLSDFSKSIKDAMLDVIMFDYLVQEEKIPALIKICNTNKVDRFELIDKVKEEMVELLLDEELPEKIVEVLDKDIELIPVEFLSSKLGLQHKRTILFNLYEVYPEVLRDINHKAMVESNKLINRENEKLIKFRGTVYEECHNN